MNKQTFLGKNKQFIIDWISQMPLDSEKKYDIEIKQHRNKRSLDCNALCWLICDKIAEVIGEPKTEVYRRAIKEIGGNSYIMLIESKNKDKFIRDWERNGIGWICEFTPSNVNGCENAILYSGSSVYDTATMSRLINNLMQEIENLDIDFMPRSETDKIISQWESYDG